MNRCLRDSCVRPLDRDLSGTGSPVEKSHGVAATGKLPHPNLLVSGLRRPARLFAGFVLFMRIHRRRARRLADLPEPSFDVSELQSMLAAGELSQEEYARLSKEIETWKQLMARTAPGPEREAALDQIMGREKAFGDVRQREAAFFKRLFSGEALVRSALDERNKLDALLMQIAEQGTQVSIGEPQSHMIAGASDTAKIYVPVTLQTTPAIVETLERTALSLGGQVKRTEYARRSSANSQRNDKGIVIRMGKNEEIARFFQSRVRALTFRVNIILKNGEALSCNTWEENRDIKHPQYFETNPIAQVFGIYDRFRNEDASKQDLVWWLQRKAGALEFEEEPPVLWFSNDEVMILSSSKPDFHKPLLDRPDFNFASIVIGGSSGLAFSQRPPSFGVVAFEYPRNFTVTTQLPLVLANQIKAVTGDFIFSDKVPAQAIQKIVNCNIEP